MFSQKQKIEGATKTMMLATAIAIDVLELILLMLAIGSIANEYIDVFGNLMFVFWFFSKGVSPFKKNRLLNFFGNFVGEFITLGLWFGFTVMVWRTIKSHNEEVDKDRQSSQPSPNKSEAVGA